jgi:hypothetical protein
MYVSSSPLAFALINSAKNTEDKHLLTIKSEMKNIVRQMIIHFRSNNSIWNIFHLESTFSDFRIFLIFFKQ